MKFLKLRNVILFILATIVPLFLWNRLQGVDNLYMYAHAEDMLQNGFYRTTDIFSMHENFAFLYQKWAACILTYVIVRGFGWQGLTVATYVLIFLLLASLYLFGAKFNSSHKMLNTIAIMICAYLLEANGTLRFRPHMMAGLVFIYLFYVIERYVQFELKSDIKFYLRFVIASVVLMWFHSTMWIMYVIIFLPYVMNFQVYHKWFPRLFFPKTYQTKPLFIAMILMFLTGFLNPNGIKQYTYMFSCMRAAGTKYSHVDELQSMPFSAYLILLTVCGLLIVYLVYMINVYHIRLYVPSVYLIIGSMIMPLLSWRLVFYSAIFLVIAYVLQTGRIFQKDLGLKPFVLPMMLSLMIILILAAGGISRLFLSFSSKTAFACGTKSQEINDAVDFVADLNDQATIFTTTAHVGSYGIYRHLKPYMDCRAEIYDIDINHQSDILSEIHELRDNQYQNQQLDSGGMELLQKTYHPDYYVLTKYSDEDLNIKKALDKSSVSCIFGGDNSEVWVYKYQ